MSVSVYAPLSGLIVRLKVEDHNNNARFIETDATTTVANAWETLIFDFNSLYIYDKASIFFDFGNSGTGLTFDWNIIQYISKDPIALPVNFDDVQFNHTTGFVV